MMSSTVAGRFSPDESVIWDEDGQSDGSDRLGRAGLFGVHGKTGANRDHIPLNYSGIIADCSRYLFFG